MKRKKTVFRIVYAATLIAFCVTGLFLLDSYRQRELADNYYKDVRDFASEEERNGSDALLSETSPSAVTVMALRELRKEYPDLAAWIRIPETEVDYPAVQGEDNVYYLNHLPDGSDNQAGSIFMDSRCLPKSRHLILYGHNMRGGKMFGSLRRYRDKAYYEEHPSLTLYTEQGSWECPIFSVHVVSAYDGDTYAMFFASDADFDSFVRELSAASLYETNFNLKSGDGAGMRVVTLSTCTEDSRERLVIHAAMPLNKESLL